ncbi:MAG: hypothetical protein DRP51_01280 [Candidatus Zixiibacteriota bacterium]|nr:MAG: hypothetical protein DRP51_01280 [candidate division Zixibacteria bacterium]
MALRHERLLLFRYFSKAFRVMLRDYSKLPHPIITVIRPIAFQNLLYFNSAFIIDNLTAAKIFFVEMHRKWPLSILRLQT